MFRVGRVITLVFLVFISLTALADTLTGKVVKITDGDTLYVLDANYQQHKIRLARIDAPNTSRRMDWLTGRKVRSVAREQSQSAVGISVLSRSPSNPQPIAMTASLLGHRSTRLRGRIIQEARRGLRNATTLGGKSGLAAR